MRPGQLEPFRANWIRRTGPTIGLVGAVFLIDSIGTSGKVDEVGDSIGETMRRILCLGPVFVAAFTAGCVSPPPAPVVVRAQNGTDFASEKPGLPKNGDAKTNGNGNGKDDREEDKPKEPPKTIFEWAIGPELKKDDAEPEEDVIQTDRPDFVEASTTVGLGRWQLEAGYTYYGDRSGASRTITQTYPEALLRIGVIADWCELRLGQTYAHSPTTVLGHRTEHATGWSDLYVGTKLALTEQKAYLPEAAVVLQATIPSGAREVTAGKVLPGINLLYGWDIIPDCLSLGASSQVNGAVDDETHTYLVFAQAFTIGYTLTEKLGAYTEWFALFPASAISPGVRQEQYVDGGFTYKVTPNFQLDIRAGKGLTENAQDYFLGAGFAVRY